MKKGKIVEVEGSWMSGLATLVVEDEEGNRHTIHADNGPLFRSLERYFGDVIKAGRTADTDNVEGKWIYYEVTPWDTLAGFVPAERAPTEVKEKYKREKKKLEEEVT